jgi:hypothetical protein
VIAVRSVIAAPSPSAAVIAARDAAALGEIPGASREFAGVHGFSPSWRCSALVLHSGFRVISPLTVHVGATGWSPVALWAFEGGSALRW